MQRLATRSAATLAAALLTACAVGPDYEGPDMEMPDSWQEPQDDLANTPANLDRYWENFGDDTLNKLVQQAFQRNLDVRRAWSRIRATRASKGVAKSELGPQISVDPAYTRQFIGEEAFGFGFEREFDIFSASLNASWELDLFGRIRRSIESAHAEVGVSVEDMNGVVVTLVTDITSNYVLWRSFERRIEIAAKNLQTQQETLELTKARAAGGLVPDLDVARAESNVATTAASIPLLKQGRTESLNRLSTLLGGEPGLIDGQFGDAGVLPEITETLAAGLPAHLLRNRPDIRRAERALAAQTAQIGVAVSDYYPRFFIDGSFGVTATDLGVLDGRALLWNVGPRMNWLLFSSGRVSSNVEAQRALAVEAELAWRQTVLNALAEVENALAGVRNERERASSLRAAAQAARRSRDLASRLYREGLTDFNAVLDAEQTLLIAEDRLAVSETDVLQRVIQLYTALGGGWPAPAGAELDDRPTTSAPTALSSQTEHGS